MHPQQLTALLLTFSALSTAAVTKTRTVTECSTITLVHHDASSTYSDISTFSTAVVIPETSSSPPNTTTTASITPSTTPSITPSITPTVTPVSVTAPSITAPVSTGSSSPVIIPSGGAGGAAPSSNFTLPAGTGKAPFPTAGGVTSGMGVPTGGASATGVPVSPPSQAPSSGATTTSTVNFAVGSILALGAIFWGLC